VRRLLAGTSSDDALGAFQHAMDVVFTADQSSPEWSAARVQVVRCRRLREIGSALNSVADCGVPIPSDLAPWLQWARVREVDGRVLT
jgi:hypothetical protein